MKRRILLPQKLVDIFRGNEEEALRAFLLSLLTKNKEEFPFDPSLKVWEQTELLSPIRGGKVGTISDLWFKLCLLSYSESPYPDLLQISGKSVKFVDMFYSSHNTRCFCFEVEGETTFVFAPFLPKSLWEEICLGFGKMCQTQLDTESGIHQGIKELSETFSEVFVNSTLWKGKSLSCWDVDGRCNCDSNLLEFEKNMGGPARQCFGLLEVQE
ncbi:hypothetical protein GMAR_ORF142 [Golden Marseillevirus]|uniref:hypothetical protein n=1 Tax=Golden Marseillevirus TaxID=1720526 RepID=UPI000877A8CD|nr:hypothetical protein GMAR_ORF142 [Golden Marseillevirus]ALX27516.1 hypothetical protein GMAR_ORF142 [Golden Marseillevirus]